MALSDILKKIEQTATTALKKIQVEHDERIKDLEASFQEREKKNSNELDKKIKGNIERLHKKAEIHSKMSARNEILQAKRALVDDIFQDAVQKLLNDSHYEEIISTFLKQSDAPEDAVVIPAKGKESITSSALSQSGKPYTMSSETADIAGGFVLRSKKIEINYSFHEIMKNTVQQQLEEEVASTLFS